ncbi:hypothetical protein L6452_03947 [Arctium lappa]|uniref:Uncharacterized protein n=1 Tax=Arctium lappa TaxID=4217 RepID=A0ACB9FNA9_ARCLA|nr:hypothetical protein L6452_03947 [Arctium lappa]
MNSRVEAGYVGLKDVNTSVKDNIMLCRISKPEFQPCNCRRWWNRYAFQIVLKTMEILMALPSLVDVKVPNGKHFTVCGDVYGQPAINCDIFCGVQANQRAGRAGITRPGKCYRLYPSAVYHDNLLDATVPEIQQSSLALDLPDIDILKFDFLDAPSLVVQC